MKAFVYWSGGKDAAMAVLTHQKQNGSLPQLLVCTITETDTVAAHLVHKINIEAQAQAMGINVHFITIPAFAPNTVYEEIVNQHLQQLKQQGYTHAICGDIFLAEIKDYRTRLHHAVGIECIFPLWGTNTQQLSQQTVNSGIEAVIASVNTKHLPAHLAGSKYNLEFINELPQNVDACGENGEFHTLVYNAPYFKYPLVYTIGQNQETVYHKGTEYETAMAGKAITCYKA